MESEEIAFVKSAREEMERMEWPNPETVTRGITSIHDADSQSSRLKRIQNQTISSEEGPVEVGITTM